MTSGHGHKNPAPPINGERGYCVWCVLVQSALRQFKKPAFLPIFRVTAGFGNFSSRSRNEGHLILNQLKEIRVLHPAAYQPVLTKQNLMVRAAHKDATFDSSKFLRGPRK
jgi:hypothetical protein